MYNDDNRNQDQNQNSSNSNSSSNSYNSQYEYSYKPKEQTPYRPSTAQYTPPLNNSYPYMTAKPVKPAKENKSKRMMGFGAVVVSLAFVFSMAGTMLGNSLSPKQENPLTTNQIQSNEDNSSDASSTASEPQNDNSILKTAVTNGSDMTIEQVAATASNSVVEITTESLTTGNRMQQFVSTGAGSGVIISADGYIVTNNHVIDGSSKITVTLKDGTQHEAALVGTDPKTDIAVIKITATGLSPATLGTSKTLKVGQDAVVIGNPLGQLGGTVTNGIISALDREITIDGEVMNLLQTNAAINPGNSGGGMFNLKGQLIGVVNAKSSGSDVEGLGFAIPIDVAKPVIEDLIQYGYVQGRIELGITMVDIEDSLTAMMYRVNKAGVYILNVEENSNAAKAGLSSGDRIVSFDGQEIANSAEISAILKKHSVGDSINIEVERGGQKGSVALVLQDHIGISA